MSDRWDRVTTRLNALEARDGVLRLRAVEQAGIHDSWVEFIGNYEKVERGLYVSRGRILDPLALTVAKTPRLVVGMTTALWLRGAICDRPCVPMFVLGRSDRRPRWTAEPARFMRSAWPDLDIDVQTINSVAVRIHRAPRAAVDCVRYLSTEEAQTAVKAAVSGGVTTAQLLAVAQRTRFLAPMNRFLDALPR